ncbi:MAG: 30S ribosomal protein S20 [Acidobacteriota bacterium]
MAHSLSAAKRIRQNETRRLRNRSRRSQFRTQIKRLREAIDSQDVERVQALYTETVSLIDRLVKKDVIHDNAGSRYKSRLAGKLGRL